MISKCVIFDKNKSQEEDGHTLILVAAHVRIYQHCITTAFPISKRGKKKKITATKYLNLQGNTEQERSIEVSMQSREYNKSSSSIFKGNVMEPLYMI